MAAPGSHPAGSGPERISQQRQADALWLRGRVPAALDCFDGHFPGHPVLPGFVQLDWVARLAREELSCREPVAAVEALRFRAPLLPGQDFELRLEALAGGVRFAFREDPDGGDGRELSSGRLRFDPMLTTHRPADAPPPDAGRLPLRIPHAGPMRLLDAVIAHDGPVTLCRARVGESAPLLRDGRAPAWLALELMAQAMAAQGGLEADPAAAPRRGFLVGAPRLELRTRGFHAGEWLWVRVRHLRGETGLVACDCTLGSGAPPGSDAEARSLALALAPLRAFVAAGGFESANP